MTRPAAPDGDAVRAKIFFITLAVDNLHRSVAFYRDGLGWPTEGIVGQEFHDEVTGADGTIAFFKLDGGLLLGVYERANLAKDASLPSGRVNWHRMTGVIEPSLGSAQVGVAHVGRQVGQQTTRSAPARSPRSPHEHGMAFCGARSEMSRASVQGSSSFLIRFCRWNNPLSGVVRGGCE